MKYRSLPLAFLISLPTLVQSQRFQAEEASIASIHAAMDANQLTCRSLVSQYLASINAYDKTGPAINALIVVNPNELAVAD